mgnify:CR=1 FL=1
MSSKRKKYIQLIAPAAVQIMKDTGLLASLTIAQAVLESGDGESTLAKEHNNHFGIKGKGDAGTAVMKTKEEVGGKIIQIEAGFRKYSSIEACFADRTNLLRNARIGGANSPYRYRHIFGMTDYIQACQAIQKAGYATSSIYAQSLIDLIAANNLTQYDKAVAAESEVPTWAKAAIDWGVEAGIFDGTRVNENVTRAEVITMLHRLSKGGGTNGKSV